MFGERIRECRVIANETQDELGNLVEVSQRTISSWEKCLRQPPYETLISICKHYSVSSDYILGLTDERDARYNPQPKSFSNVIFPQISEDDLPKNQNDLTMFMRGFMYAQSLKK